MNVYGITLSYSINYGTLFQAYALQNVIEGMEIDGERCNYKLIHHREIQGSQRLKDVKGLKSIILYLAKKYYRLSFLDFENRQMHYQNISSLDKIGALNESADAFVCGSDCIWDPLFNHGMGCFYLDFAKKYAFSYAASFGKADISEDMFPVIGNYLANLNRISVREKKSKEIVQKCIDIPVILCIDPVFLLSAKDWNAIHPKENKHKKYILAYTTTVSQSFKEFVQQLSRQTGLKVIYTAANVGAALRLKEIHYPKPAHWLSLLRDAEYVVSSSFHGTAFSIIFNKKFFSIGYGHSAEESGYNMRMINILNELKLESRMLYQLPDKIDLSDIDYSYANRKLAQMRDDSIEYIKDCLTEAKAEK